MVRLPSPLTQFEDPLLESKGVRLWIKRDDLIHPLIMGNKWRKLKYNIKAARDLGKRKLLTFGGAFSNHIVATAAAAQESGFQSVGIIRGEELSSQSNPTLMKASELGMALKFVSRSQYKAWTQEGRDFKAGADTYIIPEGGTNSLAIQGAAELVAEIKKSFDSIVVAYGTGGTMAGLVWACGEDKQVIGVSSLKGDFIHDAFSKLLDKNGIIGKKYALLESYHFGGYGKTTSELIDFINTLKQRNGLQLDPVYTGKAFYALLDLIRENHFDYGSNIVFVHTGGLQGIDGFNQKHDEKILL